MRFCERTKRINFALGAALTLLFGALAGSGFALGNETRKSEQPRFRFCKGVGDGCTHPGTGYSVCERFLKMLNSLPPKEQLPVCEIRIPPEFSEFALPEWEDMPAAESMRLVYDMEMHRLNNAGRVPPEWKQYYPDEHWKTWDRFWEPKAWRRVPYDIWLVHYRARMDMGEIAPRLRRVRAALNENGPETLIAYEWIPGGDAESCRRNLGTYATGGSHIYLMTADAEQPIREISGVSNTELVLLSSRGKALFLFTNTSSSSGWFLSINVARPPLPVHLEPDRWRYVVGQRCAFKLNKQP